MRQHMKRRPHFLYRHFDSRGRLLYVGISCHLLNRTSNHESLKEWFRRVRRIDLTPYKSRRAALNAETIAINSENPALNVRREDIKYRRRKPSEFVLAYYAKERAKREARADAFGKLRARGWSAARIGAKFGISDHAVWAVIRRVKNENTVKSRR